MENKKLKCYVITVSEHFPSGHRRSGEPTDFVQSIIDGKKIHTVRGNYPFWKKRIDEVINGRAYLSIRVWTGKPYRSKQKEIIQFHQNDGVGIQRVEYERDFMEVVAESDGLTVADFNSWFREVKPKTEMAIIHFTSFRYTIVKIKPNEI